MADGRIVGELTRAGQRVVRVTDTVTGHQITVPVSEYEAGDGRYQLAGGAAVAPDGCPAPPKPRVELGTEWPPSNNETEEE